MGASSGPRQYGSTWIHLRRDSSGPYGCLYASEPLERVTRTLVPPLTLFIRGDALGELLVVGKDIP